MRIAAFFLMSFLLQQSNGCENTTPPTAVPIPQPTPPAHRFEGVAVVGSAGVALDTVTGQWRRTWDWQYKAKPDADSLNTLPTCLSLFEQTWEPPATLRYNPTTHKIEPIEKKP
jgi:hypothetical protein